MFNFIYDYLFKKIEFDEIMINCIDEIQSIQWGENVGKPLKNIECKYKILQITNDNDALNYLKYEDNYKDIVCLENLLNEGNNRTTRYLSNYKRREYDGEWNRVTDKANKIIDFKKIENKELLFNKRYNSSVNLYLSRFIYQYLHCLYFKRYDKNIPSFGLDIFDIYRNGHLILGWKGSFPSPSPAREIMPEEGILLVW